ncbi:MAG: TetR/AcrR family transcriptional regulator [Deltaproteobacteria bacterium]|nr:MAG: TetR/AcrR family transcriptional regulator [Deltaproteobacteria bacterium]
MTKHLPEDVRKTQILDAARRCFIEKGYFATRMEDIAREAGLSKGGIYFHFDGKRALFNALVKEEFEKGTSAIERVASEVSSYEEAFRHLAEHFLRFFTEQPDYARFLVVIAEMAGRDSRTRKMLLEMLDVYISALEGLLERGIAAGQIRRVDTRSVAIILKGVMDAIEAYVALGVELDTASVAAAAIDMLSHGIMADAGRKETT